MKDINTVLNMIRVRPALFLGELSITRLCMFMHGYTCAVSDCTGSEEMGKPLGQLTWHLTHKYHILESLDWSGILLSIKNGNEKEALSSFWEEWDQYTAKPCTCPQEILGRPEYEGFVWRYCGCE